jgi:hypothetical protein
VKDTTMPDSNPPTTGTSYWYWDDGTFGLPVIVQCTRTDYGDLAIDDPQFIYLVGELVDSLVQRGPGEHEAEPTRPPSGDIDTTMLPTVGDFAGVIRTGKATLVGLTVEGKLALPRQ